MSEVSIQDDRDVMSNRNPASFRDPSGYVFERSGRIFRAIDEKCAVDLRSLIDSGVFAELIEEGFLVGTQFVCDDELLESLRHEHCGYDEFLEHEFLPSITYPYEWPLSALADAAILTLELQTRLLKSGFTLKDATAYNVQFRTSGPVFIDISSIERSPRLDVWKAWGQFSQMFTFPLLLFRHHGWDFRSYFLGSIGGRNIDQMASSLSRGQSLLPRYMWDVTLPAFLHKLASKRDKKISKAMDQEHKNAGPQIVNLNRLRQKIQSLAKKYRTGSDWSNYTSTCTYDDESELAKKSLVRDFFETTNPATVLDLGCNTGDYSYIAAESGASVLAVDSDHDSAEFLYRRIRKQPAAITPLVMDMCNPSPAIGHLNQERQAFIERVSVDCVLALALVHHLHVSGNLPIHCIRDLLASTTRRDLVVEFVPVGDVMFQKLISLRSESFEAFTLDEFRRVFTESFEILQETQIQGSSRTLLCLRKKN